MTGGPRVRTAQLLLGFILLTGLVYVTEMVAGGTLFHRPHTVTVELAAGGGLHEKSQVTYRGVRVGQVADLRLGDEGVEVTLELDRGTRVPRDTEAVVANLSAVGEQYLDLRPRTDDGPYLADGDRIQAADTRLPASTHDLLLDLDHLVRRIDLTDVRTVSRELDLALGGRQVDLLRTAQESDRTLAMLERIQPATISILERGQVPLRTTVDGAGELRTFSRQLRQITAEMEDADPVVNGLVDRAVVAVPELSTLLEETEGSLGRLLTAGLVPAEVAAERLPGLEHWLDWVPAQMVAMAESTRDGSGRVLLVPSPSKNCTYDTEQFAPTATRRRPASRDARCTTEDPRVQQRGAQYAPRPRR